MSSLNFNSSATSDGYVITCSMTPDAIMPGDVFLMKNTDTGLGEFVGICSIQDYTNYKTWEGVPIRVFGNRFVKVSMFSITIPLDKDPSALKALMVADLKKLKNEFLKSGPNVTEIIEI